VLLLIVVLPGFGRGVWLLRGCGQVAQPDVPRVRTGSDRAGGASFRVGWMVRAGQAGAGRAQSRCQQVRKACFQGQPGLIFKVRWRAWAARRAGMCQIR